MSETLSEYTTRIAENPIFNSRLNLVKKTTLVTVVVSLVISVVTLLLYLREEYVEAKKPAAQQLTFLRRKFMFFNVIQALSTAALAVWAMYTYVPSNSEISTAILIKYLQLQGTLDRELYDVVKKLKPHNMSKLNLGGVKPQ